jgi:hypothetical protein
MRILITGANAPGVNGTCWSLRQKDLFPTHLELFGSDINNVMDNKYFTKTFYLPSGLDPTYLDKINELCINESIDLVVPQTTIETNFLSQLTDSSTQFKSVILKPRELVSELSNKSKVYKIIESLKMCLNNYKICSNTNDLHELTEMLGPHDYFIKTSNLSGGRGIVKVVSEIARKNWPEKIELSYAKEVGNSEAITLGLDPTLAINALKWIPTWSQEEAVASSIKWWVNVLKKGISPLDACLIDITNVLNHAHKTTDNI